MTLQKLTPQDANAIMIAHKIERQELADALEVNVRQVYRYLCGVAVSRSLAGYIRLLLSEVPGTGGELLIRRVQLGAAAGESIHPARL